jgi:hypothetical protein
MNKYICLLLLAVVLTNGQDLPWPGNYTVTNTINTNGSDISQCCVPSALNIIQDQTNAKLLTLDLDFGAGSAQCDANLIGMITIQQAVTYGRIILNDSSTTLNGASVIYLLNNGTILLMFPNGCQSYYGNGTVLDNSTLNYADRYQGIWVVESFWSSDPNQASCCMNLQPLTNSYDEFTKTEAWIDDYPDDPICPEEYRATFTYSNNSVEGFGAIDGTYSEFVLQNGTVITYDAPPFCNVLWVVKKPNLSTNLCDYMDSANNAVNSTDANVTNAEIPVASDDQPAGGV